MPMGRALIYVVFGLLTTGWAWRADRAGWMTRDNVVHNVPRSIRDNPGAYRSLYAGGPRLFGGK
jgi:hypothetical protein